MSRVLICFVPMLFVWGKVPASPQETTAPLRDFSFVHMSDTHVEAYPTTAPEQLQGERSYNGVRSLANLREIPMPAYSLTAPRPTLAIATGDITEFGFPGVTEEVVDLYFSDLGMPVYLAPGNHDNTQVAMPSYWRRHYGGQNYSFDSQGCHFIGLNSASLQDPNPSFGEEVLTFLEKDLEKVRPSTPVVVYFHHPLKSGEFASPYDTDRLLDALRRHNVILLLVGHGHAAVRFDFAGVDGVMGGSTFVAKRQRAGADGFGLCYLKGDDLYYAYHPFEKIGATKPLLHKKIPPYSDYPVINVATPEAGKAVREATLTVTAGVAGTSGSLRGAEWSLDDESTGVLEAEGEALYGMIDISGLDHGAHYLRISFEDASGKKFQRSTVFYREPSEASSGRGKTRRQATTSPTISARWRFPLGAATKATPLVADGRVYIGANDGVFRAIDAETGRLVWSHDAKAEILTTALRHKDLVLFGTGGGKFVALKASTGKPAWSYDAGAAIYSSPVAGPEGEVCFGTNKAELHALDAGTGKLIWRNSDALYSIEASPAVEGDRIYFGAWDGYLYCADRKSGKTLWKAPSAWNREKVVRYYAPADASPVVAGEHVFAADRGYLAGRWSRTGGDLQTTVSADAAALAVMPDGKSLLVRGTKTPLTRINLDGEVLWQSDFVPGRIPAAPTVSGDTIYLCNNTGVLHAVDADTGRTRWKYRVTPSLYVMAGIGVGKDTVYAAGTDGVLTAISLPEAEEKKK